MGIALLKSKNQFALKTNPPTHTPFFSLSHRLIKQTNPQQKNNNNNNNCFKTGTIFSKTKQANKQTNK
jgi:hypothetical protein